MPIKSYNPTTPTRRFKTVVSREDITKQTPEKTLVAGKKRTGGRTSTGRDFVAVPRRRAQAGLSRDRFQARQAGIAAKVAAIEYDPNRTRAHRAAALRRRREALHLCAGRPRSRAAR